MGDGLRRQNVGLESRYGIQFSLERSIRRDQYPAHFLPHNYFRQHRRGEESMIFDIYIMFGRLLPYPGLLHELASLMLRRHSNLNCTV